MNWKILLSDGLSENGQSILRSEAQVDDREGISADDLLKIIKNYDALIVRSQTKVNEDVLNAAHILKVIGRAGVGVDNIDLKAARLRGITVVNAPTATTQAVAELTMTLILCLARSIPLAVASTKAGEWRKKELQGNEVSGKTLGVIGVGNIGSSVSILAGALGMKVIGFDAYLTEYEITDRGAQPVSLARLFADSDFISLHVPLTEITRLMINQHAFSQMKRGVRLVSTARGGIIDENALLNALESGIVSSAALDVYSQEPPGLTELVSHPSVITTPHIGAQTQEAQNRAAEDIAREVLAALHGEPLHWKVV